jgi:hypothetical protein
VIIARTTTARIHRDTTPIMEDIGDGPRNVEAGCRLAASTLPPGSVCWLSASRDRPTGILQIARGADERASTRSTLRVEHEEAAQIAKSAAARTARCHTLEGHL